MSSQSLDLVWILIVGTIVFLGLAVGIIAAILVNQRRLLAARKTKWEEIEKREAQYRDLFNNVSDIVYIHSLDGRVLQINLAVTRFLGYKREEIITNYLRDFIVPQKLSELDDYLRKVKAEGEASGFVHLTGHDGAEHIFEYRSSVISQDGEAVAVRGIARNVTAQRRAERALRESEERFRRLLKYSPVPIAVHTRGRWVYINDAGLKLICATKAEQVIGQPVLFLMKPEQRKAVRQRIKGMAVRSREVTVMEEEIVRLDGTEIEIEIVAIPITYQNVHAGQVVVRDVTERKRMQEELARAQRLETAGRVAGQIAHDFNNLLAPLTAYPTLIREELSEHHPALELIEEMESAAIKIAEINQQLLTLSRRGHYTMEAVDFNELVQKTLRSQRLPAEIAVDLDLDGDLLKTKGGGAQLTRALTNLILNARDAMQGIGRLRISTKNVYLDEPLRGYQTVKKGEYVKLSIADSGTGIDPRIMQNIFDPFFTTKRSDRTRGSGLGLSVVHGIIEDHHGYVTVDSKLGEGTTFSLYFPIARDLEAVAVEVDGLLSGNGEQILVVDDDPIQRSVAHHLLKRLGYRVHQVASGEEALEYLRDNPQDLLLLDMVMDGIDGVETYRQVLEFRPDQKAIILSGYAMSERVEEALSLGAGSFVSKPVTPKMLAKAIREELERPHQNGRLREP